MSMNRYFAALVLACVSLTSPFTYARQAELQDPAPLAVPADRSPDEAMRAVEFALATRGWVVEARSPDQLTASYSPRSHVARIAIVLAGGQVTIRYVESQNLNFEQDGDHREIHPAYNTWVAALHDEIDRTLKAGVAADAPLPAVTGGRSSNPPPTHKFSEFDRFELLATTMGAPYAGQPANDDALRNIQHALDLRLAPQVAAWNASEAAGGRLLRIEPRVDHIRFIGTAARVFAGRMAGRSSVILKVRYLDVASGKIVAEPEFYLIADAANGFSVSARDYKMLENVAQMAADYTLANYEKAVGGGLSAPPGLKAE